MKRPLVLLLLGLATLAAALTWQRCAPQQPAEPPVPAAAVPTRAPDETGNTPAQNGAPDTEERAQLPVGERETAPDTEANAEARQGVTGRAVDAAGRPVAGVQVALLDSSSNDPIGSFLSRAQGVPTLPLAAGESDRDGRFRLGVRKAADRDRELCLLAEGFASERVGGLRIHADEWLDLGDVTLLPGVSIHGRVTVAGTDLPAPQAIVSLESGNPFFDLGPGQLDGWRERMSTTVDQNGRYELPDAPRSGLFRLLAVAPGFGRQVQQVELSDRGPVEIDFALPRGLSIGGRIDTGGRPLTAAAVTAYAKAAEPAYQGTVGSDGRFFVHGLREGPHLIKISADGYQPVDVDDVQAGRLDLEVALQPRARAGVVVRTPQGQVLRRYRLAVRRFFAPEPAVPGAAATFDFDRQPGAAGQIASVPDVPERVVHLQPGADAAFVEGLDHGFYAFQVYADGFAATVSPPFELDADHVDVRVEMVMSRGGGLVGVVVDHQGAPVQGATVTTQPDGAAEENPVWRMLYSLTPDRITRAEAVTDAAGRFELQGLAHAVYQLRVEHPEFCRNIRRELEVTGDQIGTVAPITLQRGALVRGRALGSGRNLAQVQVVLTPVSPPTDGRPEPLPKSGDETTPLRVEAVTNNEGSFVLPRRVPPGTYELRGLARVPGDPGADALQKLTQMKNSAVTIRVQPGQELVEVLLQIPDDR